MPAYMPNGKIVGNGFGLLYHFIQLFAKGNYALPVVVGNPVILVLQ
jgi:hypothetical protein